MTSRQITITTKKAIITSEYTLVTQHGKYFPPQNLLNEYPQKDVTRILYRRFVRLKPFVSRRQMVRDTYVGYIRYKFRNEDYEKRRIASGLKFAEKSENLSQLSQRALATLEFVLKAISHVKKSDLDTSHGVEISMCRKILKNLLTIEHDKRLLIQHNPKFFYPVLRQEFSYFGNHALVKKPLHVVARLRDLREYDACLLKLNETLGTML
ncbi:LAMI_0F05116g1_1 [Lachancea mirantina]|uniref:LAMI_0F05116g1_1 n=1 Tax=Lachancea mirantina TaxID=1230905 RepID=A0A1G4JY13_9SACH|nr:LAMI_0F05116g1_1 [Lachancea mirantina]